MNLPTGTVTFLFTDIEGSTKLWERCPDAMRLALARHDTILRDVIERHNGYVFKTVGDAFCAAFRTAANALNAAIECHLILSEQAWGETGPIRVRMGLHTGEAEERDNDYFGQTLNRVARLQGVGHGQQTLISHATYELLGEGLPPGVTLQDMGLHRLKDLAAPEHVWQVFHPALPQEYPPLKSLDYLPTNLPQQTTSFVGRNIEMTEGKALLKTTRLLTTIGAGGTGKTRLSLQIGADLIDEYKDGVWIVELASLPDASLVPQAVARALNLREEPGRAIEETLKEFLQDKHLLLLLDNCEHVLATVAPLSDSLLKRCANLRILASSREALGIAGELKYPVPSLSIPNAGQSLALGDLLQYESVQLFVERALFQQPSFVLTDRNTPAMISLCRRLDGIPLAIELAAARVRSLSVEEINDKLDNRFRLLTSGNRTALPRQQTLRALVDWSYALLKNQEKTLLCRVSVFAGGWTLAAAEDVGSGVEVEDWEVLDLLTSLVDKSLVVSEQEHGQTRYRLLETIRQYAGDRLQESGGTALVRDRHRDYFLAFAEDTAPRLSGPEQGVWLQRLEEEHGNLRTALERSLETTGSVAGLRLCAALARFWRTRGHLSEGREWCVRMLGHDGAQKRTMERATALNVAGVLARTQGQYAVAQAHHEESLSIRREIHDRSGIAEALNNLGVVAYRQGYYASGRAYYEESLSIRREIGDRIGIAATLNDLGNVVADQGDYSYSWSQYNESLSIRRELGDLAGIAASLNNLATVAFCQGDYATAQAYLEQCLPLRREIGDREGIAISLDNLAIVTQNQGNYPVARAHYEESLTIRREIGDQSGVAASLNGLGNLAVDLKDFSSAWVYYRESLSIRRSIQDRRGLAILLECIASVTLAQKKMAQAAILWGAAEALREVIGAPLSPNEREQYNRNVTAAGDEIGHARLATAWSQGRAMTMEQAIEYALEEPTDA